ncbi:MAG: DUF4388 domain-containing protein [Candidatus Dormibacteria bacterium]
MQNQGSIGPTTVAELLQTMQQERATGTLSLASDGHQCALHFLFGHLFHAVGADTEGERAVIAVLGWQDGDYNFNPRAKLPPEETISSSTEDLLAEWRSGERGRRAPVPAEVAVLTPAAAQAADEDGGDPDWLGAVGAGAIMAEAAEPADITPFQTPEPPLPKPPAPSRPALQPAAASREPVGATPSAPNWPAARNFVAPETAAKPTRSAPPPPTPAPATGGQRPVAGSSRTQLSVVIPMPSGAALHSGLKATFLNFPMLLKTLGQDGFSGYVTVRGERDQREIAHILFREGAVVQVQQRGQGTYRRGKQALQEVMRSVGGGEGLIDAIELDGELVSSVAALVVASTVFLQLPSRIVDFDALITYVQEQSLTGGILVTSGAEDVSVVLLADGESRGNYSASAADLAEGTEVAAAAGADRQAVIDVISVPSGAALAPLDLAEFG